MEAPRLRDHERRLKETRNRLAKKLEARFRVAPTSPDLDSRRWSGSHLVTLVILDRSAVVRLGAESLDPVDALYASISEEDFPHWQVSVPVLHRDIELSTEHLTQLSSKGVCCFEGGELIKIAEGPDTACLSVRLWTHSPTPHRVQCNIGEFSDGLEITVRPPDAEDPAAGATGWHIMDGESEFVQADGDVPPVNASILAAVAKNPSLLETAPLSSKWVVSQPGVVLCRAGLIYPACRGMPFESETLALVWDRHAVAAFIFQHPEYQGLSRILSRAWGRFFVDEATGRVTRQYEYKFFVLPFRVWDAYLTSVREGYTELLRKGSRGLGQVCLRLARERFTDDSPSTSVKVNAVATYCRFESCRTLFLRRPEMRLGKGWTATSFARATEEYQKPSEWAAKIEELCEKMNSVSASTWGQEDRYAIDIDRVKV